MPLRMSGAWRFTLTIGFCLMVVFHWLFSAQGNALLHLVLVLTVCLTLSGIAFRYKILNQESNRMTRWLHTQRLLFYAMVILAVVGHAVGIATT